MAPAPIPPPIRAAPLAAALRLALAPGPAAADPPRIEAATAQRSGTG